MLTNKACGLKLWSTRVLVLPGEGLVLPFNGSLAQDEQNRGARFTGKSQQFQDLI